MHRVDEGVSPPPPTKPSYSACFGGHHLLRLVLVSIRPRAAMARVAIVGVGDAKRRVRRLGGVAQPALAVDADAATPAVIPHDEADAAPRRDRRAVAAAAEVQQRTARHVGIAVCERAVISIANVAAKARPAPENPGRGRRSRSHRCRPYACPDARPRRQYATIKE